MDSTDYELYEQDDEFVLSIELPGFTREAIDLSWYEGRLNVSAEYEDEARGRKRTYHQTFRMPKEIDPEAIAAEYNNGILEVHLPVRTDDGVRGQSIPIEG